MKVLMILSGNTYPPDIRVKKEVKTLTNAGYKVYLVAKRGAGQAKREILDGINIFRFDIISGNKIIEFLYHFVFIRYMLLPVFILHLVKKYQIDILHVHDLPYAVATCLIGRLLRKPVIFDMHEDYTSMLNYSITKKSSIRKNPLTIYL